MKKLFYVLISINLIFFFSSCEFFAQEKEDKEIGEFEDINIFDNKLLPDENSFITERSIVGDKKYLYTITDGEKEFPGKIVKITKKGNYHKIKILLEEALKSGYSDSHSYELESIDYYNDKLIIKATPSSLQFNHGEFEIYCVDPKDLSIDWRWIPEENGFLDIFAMGERIITFWNNFYIIFYATEEKSDGFYVVFLDLEGKQIIKRFIKSSRPTEDDDICIVNDKLLLHQYSEPLAIYDLNKLMNSNYDFNDCIDFVFKGNANIYSGIVSDGETCYFCSWDVIDSEKCLDDLILYAVSLSDYETLWTFKIDDKQYQGINSILLSNGQLFLAADYGCIYSLDSDTGQLLWKTKITDEKNPKNLLVEGCIVKNYFVIPCGSDGYLYYFDIKTGKIKGKHYVPVFGGKRHCYVENDYLYITTGSYIARLRLKEN
jgi:outer membrane protein assembly factor BamB